MIKKFGHYVLNNPWQAGLIAMGLGFIPLVGIISTLMVGLVTLRLGPRKGFWILWWSCIPNFTFAFIGYPEAVLFGLGSGITFWLIACILRYTISWNMVLESTILLGFVILLAIHVLIPDVDILWLEKYQMTLNSMTKELQTTAGQVGDSPMESLADLSGWLPLLSKITTGFLAVLILIGNIINLGVSRWWQAQLFNPTGFWQELTSISLGYVASISFIITLLLAYFTPMNFFIDTLPVFIGVFFLAGLSLTHFLCGKIKSGTTYLIVIYLSLIIFPQFVFFLVVVSAFLDSLFNVRQRFKLIQ